MTLQKAKNLLDSLNPSKSDLQQAIGALKWQIQYVKNTVTINYRESSSGEEAVKEMNDWVQKLEKKLQCTD